MNKFIIAAVAATGIVAAGCSPVGVGTVTGAAFGGVVTAALGGSPTAIAIGTAIGGAGGFLVASVTAPPAGGAYGPGVCQAVNQFGQPIFVMRNGTYTTRATQFPLLVSC